MNDICTVHVFQANEDLVNEELDVVVREWLRRANYLREIRLHQLVQQINIVKLFSGRRQQNVLNVDDLN